MSRAKSDDKTAARTVKKGSVSSEGAAKSKFANFPERQYDYDELMRDILSN